MLTCILHRHVGTNDLGYDAGKHDPKTYFPSLVCLGLQRSRCLTADLVPCLIRQLADRLAQKVHGPMIVAPRSD